MTSVPEAPSSEIPAPGEPSTPADLSARPSPYVGPRSFREGEKLYGRERETSTLLDLVIAERIVLLYSPSGAGKSSLINAALLPGLQAQGFRVLPTIRVNQDLPAELAERAAEKPEEKQTLNRYLISALRSLEEGFAADQRLPLEDLACLTLDGYLHQRIETADAAEMPAYVLVFDQFEEVLTVDPTDREAKQVFFTHLGQALRDRGRWALFAMREDYIAALDPYLRPVPTRLGSRFRLDLLEVDGAIKAIREPVHEVGVVFEPEAAQKLVDDLRVVKVQQPDGSLQEMPGLYVEPVQLQVVCARLWQDLPQQDRQITLADVEAIGDINQALAGYYDTQVALVAAKTGVSEREIRRWFDNRLITVQGIRMQVPLGQQSTEDLANHAVFALESTYLIRAEKRGGATWFELAHDRLVLPIRDSNARWFAQHLVMLQRQAEVWEEHDRPDGLLLSGDALTEAEAWAAGHAAEMNETERAFLDAARKARQTVERERRYTRRIRTLALVAMVIGVLALLASVVAFGFLLEANRQTAIASARELSSAAVNNLTVDPERSMLLALVAIEESGGPEEAVPSAIEALHRAFQENRLEGVLSGHTDRVYAVSYSPDGRYIATGSKDGTARVWNAADGALVFTAGKAGGPAVSDVSFSWDTAFLAVSDWSGAVTLWDLETRSAFLTLAPQERAGRAWSVAFSPDGGLLASGYDDGKVRVWTFDSDLPIATMDCGSRVESVAFSPDSVFVGAAADNGGAYVFLADTGELIHQLKGHQDVVNNIEFSPDGMLIATASADRTVRLWDAQTGDALDLLTGHLDWVYRAAFTPDGKSLVTSSSDRTIRLWNLRDRASGIESYRLAGHASQVFDVAVSPDGTHIVSASQDKSARIWDITPSGSRELFTVQPSERISGMASSPSGADLVVGMVAGGIEIWDMEDPGAEPKQTIGSELTGVVKVAFSPNGARLAAVSAGGQIAVWDAAGYTQQWSVQKPGAHFTSLAFLPGGAQIITGSSEGILYRWDAATGQELQGSTAEYRPAGKELPQGGGIFTVAAYPDEKLHAAAIGYENGSIALWDLDRDTLLDSLPALHSEAVENVRFHPEGGELASVSGDGIVYMIEIIGDGQTLRFGERLALENHVGAVYGLSYSPDGSLLATAGADLTTRLWDTETGSEALVLYGHNDRIQSVQFGPDGASLVTGSRDGTLRGYLLDPEALVELAHARLQRSLTDQECQVYLHEPVCPDP